MLSLAGGVLNTRLVMNGSTMLRATESGRAACVFFDPQYRGLNDKMAYGDEAKGKLKRAHKLAAMSEATIKNMIIEIERVLRPSGHLFLWIDKFMLVQGVASYLGLTDFELVDMITWDKVRVGMGYRSRRKSEFLVVLQKRPKRAKDIWLDRGIPDVWPEVAGRGKHPHAKPYRLISRLIGSVTKPGDLVMDPCAGSFVVMDACAENGCDFLGCDLIDPTIYEIVDSVSDGH